MLYAGSRLFRPGLWTTSFMSSEILTVVVTPGLSTSHACWRYKYQSLPARMRMPVLPSFGVKHVIRGFPVRQSTLMEKRLPLIPRILSLARSTSQVSGSLPKTNPLETSFGLGSKLKARWIGIEVSPFSIRDLRSISFEVSSLPLVRASLPSPKRRRFAFSGNWNTACATSPSGSTSTSSEPRSKSGMIYGMSVKRQRRESWGGVKGKGRGREVGGRDERWEMRGEGGSIQKERQ